ncbi:IclR family transcriptional regulator [Mycobacterium sp. 21AC1]|uniref:IclR family transcriptional regulator n=1 Tax=[Mycobacterium] appelbergii TaxID=2939269 RepID=UPI002938D793|nr:IclR family transcriptional regulator [Mycobacterium sp. 21AC1]MDV3125158.1 IclR family transcriptional regulator [Mycobacterium sp. 21AC1]
MRQGGTVADGRGGSGVQSVDRALALLEHLADAGGAMRLAELEEVTGLPLPTIHRLLRSLAHNGYVRQETSRRYALGPRLIRLGQSATRTLGGAWAGPRLATLVAEIGETANMAVLEADSVVYVAQVPSAHSMRMFTEVGRRVAAHSTGVGKALLSQLTDDQVCDLLVRTGMPANTARTHTDRGAFLAELAEIREQGWAVDDGEQEIGVRCVAVPLPGAPTLSAVSVSGPSGRITASRVVEIAPILLRVAECLVRDLQDDPSA